MWSVEGSLFQKAHRAKVSEPGQAIMNCLSLVSPWTRYAAEVPCSPRSRLCHPTGAKLQKVTRGLLERAAPRSPLALASF